MKVLMELIIFPKNNQLEGNKNIHSLFYRFGAVVIIGDLMVSSVSQRHGDRSVSVWSFQTIGLQGLECDIFPAAPKSSGGKWELQLPSVYHLYTSSGQGQPSDTVWESADAFKSDAWKHFVFPGVKK